MPVDYNHCNYLSSDNTANKKHANLWTDFRMLKYSIYVTKL